MRAVQSEAVILGMIGFMGVLLLLMIGGRLIRLLLRCALGTGAIFAVDVLLSPVELAVGINLFTAAFTGIFGVPGLITLYILAYILG